MEPVELESAVVLSLRPGDVLVFRNPGFLRPEQRKHVVDLLDEVFPDHESVILEGGQDIAVLRPEPGFVKRMWLRLRGRL